MSRQFSCAVKKLAITFKYFWVAVFAIVLSPILYFQGKRIRKSVPKLPEAKVPNGKVQQNTTRELNLLCLGESTMAGVGVDTHAEGFAGTLAAKLADLLDRSINWQVYAKSGFTAKLVQQEILPKIKDVPADLIVIGLGANDAFTLNSPCKWRRHIVQLIQTLRISFPNSPIFFTNMPPIQSFPAFTPPIRFVLGNLVELLGQTLAQEAAQHDLVFYNAEIITIVGWKKKWAVEGVATDFFSDGVHPSKLTYQVWAKDMAYFIVEKQVVPRENIQKAV